MKKISIFLGIVLLAAIYLPLIFSVNRAANDFPLVQSDVVSQGFNYPQAWSNRGNGIGENIIFTLWSYPTDLLFGFGSTIGISFTVLTKIIFIIPTILIGIYSMRRTLSRMGIHGIDQLPGVLLFLANTYILLLIDGGQLSIALAVSWFPAVYCFANEALEGGWQRKLRAALSFSLLSIFDIRIAYLLGFLLFLQFIFDLILASRKTIAQKVVSYLNTGLVIILVWSALNLYWIIPFFKVGINNIPSELTSSSQLQFLNFTNLVNTLFLQQPNWPLNSFGQITLPDWKFLFFLIPVVVMLFKKHLTRNELFMYIVFIVSVFLAKGANDPLGIIYRTLFNRLPGFFLFRDSTKFYALVTFSLSVLLSMSFVSLKKYSPRLKNYLLPGLIIYLCVILSPVLLNQMTGFLSEPLNRADYDDVTSSLGSDSTFGRILWLPSRPPLGYSSLVHPALDGLTTAGLRPYSTANVGSYERFNFLRESTYSQELLDILGVSYVAYPYYDTRKQELKPTEIAYYDTFSNQLISAPWVEKVIHWEPVTVLKTKSKPSLFSITSNLWWVVGSDTIYAELHKMPNFKIMDNPLIFTDSTTGLLSKYDYYQFGKILSFNKSDVDILGNFLNPDDNADTLKTVSGINGSSYWSVDINNFSKWREFLEEKYMLDAVDLGPSSPTLVVENGGTYKIQNNTHKNTMLLRLLVSPLGGTVQINYAKTIETVSEKLGTTLWGITVDPKNPPKLYKNAEFHWFVVSNVPQNESITITISGGLNAISQIAFVDSSYVTDKQKEIDQLRRDGKIIDISKLTVQQKNSMFANALSDTTLNISGNGSTQYSVSTSNNTEKKVLVFSQKYDEQWKAGESTSLPLYGLLNGFVMSNAKFEVNYSPQSFFSQKQVVLEALLTAILIAFSMYRFKNANEK